MQQRDSHKRGRLSGSLHLQPQLLCCAYVCSLVGCTPCSGAASESHGIRTQVSVTRDRLKCIFKSVLNQDLRVFLGGDFSSKALCGAASSYHMNNRDIGLLELEMPSSFSYAEESFHWNLVSPDISLLLCFFTSHLCFAAAVAILKP